MSVSDQPVGARILAAQAALASLALVLLGCTAFYFQNLDEFSFPLIGLLPYLAALTLVVAIGLFVTAWLVSVPLPSARLWFIPALAVLLWLQGTFNVPAYGPLDGTPIAWSRFALQPVREAVLLLAVVAGFVLIRRPLRGHPLLIVSALVGIQAVTATASAWRAPAMPESRDVDQSVFRFSSDDNVILIVLDTFQSDALLEILDRRPALADAFGGFTYYPNIVGFHPTTAPSIPALFLGRPYRNEQQLRAFQQAALTKGSVIADLSARGYQVDLIHRASVSAHLADDRLVDNVVPVDHMALSWRNRLEEALSVFEYTLFRASPQGVRKDIYWSGSWTLSSRVFEGYPASARHRGDMQFAEQLARYAYRDDGRPVFKFIHLYTPHPPYVLDADLKPVDGRRGTAAYTDQAEAGLRLLASLFDTLRRIGVYDSSRILVVADHGRSGARVNRHLLAGIDARGTGAPTDPEIVMSAALPLFMAKRRGAGAEALAIDQSPVWLGDVAPSLVDGIAPHERYDGLSVFSDDIPSWRRREFLAYDWRELGWGASFLEPMTAYAVEGHSWLPSSWRPLGGIARQHEASQPRARRTSR